MKLVTVAGPPSSGKTSVILKLVEALDIDRREIGGVKFDCLTSFDNLRYEEQGIRVETGFSGKFCPDHFFVSNIVTVTKGDVVSQAEREVFSFNIRQVNTSARIIFVNGITGQGASILAKQLQNAKEITGLRDSRLRFTTPAAVCSYCTGEVRIGEEHQMGTMKKMEFGEQ